MNYVVCRMLPTEILAYLVPKNCNQLDKFVFFFALIILSILVVGIIPRVVKHVWRKVHRYDFFERRGYAIETKNPKGISTWTYPSYRWISLRYGRTHVKHAVLEIKFLANVNLKQLQNELDSFSIAFKHKFHAVEPDLKEPSIFRLLTGKVPESVKFEDLPQNLPPFTACIGVSERLEPVTLALRRYSAGGLYSPTRTGKTVCAYALVASASRSTPGLKVVVLSIKNLAIFRKIPGSICLNATRKNDLSRLMTIFSEWRSSANRINDLIDLHAVESIEDLYQKKILDPLKEPRWLWVVDEAPAYLKTKKGDRVEGESIEALQSEIVKMLQEWLNTMALLSRFALIIGQSGRTDRLPIEIDNLGFKIVGRQQNDAMSHALIGSDRASKEAFPQGVFLFKDETGITTKFRVPYEPLMDGEGQS